MTAIFQPVFPAALSMSDPEFLALKHESRILGHSSNLVHVCGFSVMAHGDVWPMENWLGLP